MFSRAAAAAAAGARRAERAARHRPLLPPAHAESERHSPRPRRRSPSARRARSCASTARWTAGAGPLATDASARVRARFEPRRRSFASSSAAAAATPHETAFAAIETDAERAASFAIETETETETSFPETGGGAKDSHGVRPSTTSGTPTVTRTRSPAHYPREYAVPVRAYYVGERDRLPRARQAPARVPEGVFPRVRRGAHDPREREERLGVNEHLTGHGAPHRPRARYVNTRHDTPEGDDLNDGIHPGALCRSVHRRRRPPEAARRGGGNREQERGTDEQLLGEPGRRIWMILR